MELFNGVFFSLFFLVLTFVGYLGVAVLAIFLLAKLASFRKKDHDEADIPALGHTAKS